MTLMKMKSSARTLTMKKMPSSGMAELAKISLANMESPKMKTREEIITSMCFTWRHDYGLDRQEHDGPGGLISMGLTDAQRQSLWNQMAQIFDNDIAPNMEFRQ
jgi:hypothetical protein